MSPSIGSVVPLLLPPFPFHTTVGLFPLPNRMIVGYHTLEKHQQRIVVEGNKYDPCTALCSIKKPTSVIASILACGVDGTRVNGTTVVLSFSLVWRGSCVTP